MKAFTELYTALDATTRTNDKVAALVRYFDDAPPADAAWAVHFLCGNRPKRLVGSRQLRDWVSDAAGIPAWLFDECYDAVGDLAETMALLYPDDGASTDRPFHHWVEERLLALRGRDEGAQRRALAAAWSELDSRQLFVWNKLITGGFRVGVSQRLVVRALARTGAARAGGVDEATLAHRLMGAWQPTAEAFRALFAGDTSDADVSRPYPFFLAHPLEGEPAELGAPDDWQAEWKWDGIRAQVIRRADQVFVWSRGEELVTERFPELAEAAAFLPGGTVLDGEILPWRDGRALPFARLQRRIGRKKIGPKLLREVPVVLVAYDLLERGGEDVRGRELEWRRAALAELLAGLSEAVGDRLRLSPKVEASSWEELAALRETARERAAEGLMLKRRASAYGVGRQRGDWWKWKVEPYVLDAVLVYAQRGHGRRASLYTDYTFALWHGDALVPFAKAYSGLTDEEIRRVDRFVRRNVVERFGPVRAVKPELVFEIAFEDVRRSPRHKSGIAVRFPRIHRWRTDKGPQDADTLEAARALLLEE